MDAAGRHVFKTQKSAIKDNLYLADKIMDKLEETDTIDEEISQKVKAERTNEERIDKLLYHLKRRGPNAFWDFLEAIRTDPANEMLARDLETEYNKALRNPDQDSNSRSPPENQEEVRKDINHNHIPATPSVTSSDSLGHRDPIRELHLQHYFGILYTRLKGHMTSLNLRELSFRSPKPITFEMVRELLDQYLLVVDDCYETLGVKDRTKSLKSHIVDLKANIKQLKADIKDNEQHKNKLSHHYIKLENKLRDINRELQNKHREINKEMEDTKSENSELNQQIVDLKVLLKNTEGKLEDTTHENVQLRKELQMLRGQPKVVAHQSSNPEKETHFADNTSSSPTRNQKPSGRRKRSTFGTNAQSYRSYGSPRKPLSQSTGNDSSSNVDDSRGLPFVRLHGNSHGVIPNGSSQVPNLCISNTVKIQKVYMDSEPVINESPRDMKKNNASRVRHGRR